MSEDLVQINSEFYNGSYVKNKDWDEFEFKEPLNDNKNFEETLRDELNIEYIDTHTIYPELDVCSNASFIIPEKIGLISDMYFVICIDDFNEDILNLILRKNIIFETNFDTTKISIEYNLIIAKLLKKEIIESDGYIKIPLVLLDMLFPNKYHINKISKFAVVICIPQKYFRKIYIEYDYYEYKNHSSNANNFFTLFRHVDIPLDNMFQKSCELIVPFQSSSSTLICKFIIIDFPKLPENMYIELTKIELYINNKYPIVWTTDDILQIEIHGKVLYLLSATPEFKSTDQSDFLNSMNSGCGICLSDTNNLFKIYSTEKIRNSVNPLKISVFGFNKMCFSSGHWSYMYYCFLDSKKI
jgi:hypothetical protein